MAATPWATIEQVLEFTGTTVSATQLRRAVTTLEVQLGLIQDVERTDISDADRHWLKLATCYQAAWLAAQPDAVERSLVMNASQDGDSATFGPDGLTLAPFARKAIRQLSWLKRNSIRTGADRATPVNINSDEYEETLPWRAV